jgi:hypothetical protein
MMRGSDLLRDLQFGIGVWHVAMTRNFILAERHQHAWLKKLDRSSIDIGKGSACSCVTAG